ncbi:IclR family transcriptional regulator [Scopulibacillus cellulosilyticus]|uniref:IclR family transcriptional regulator n=1 Tax=Scopulibacillus cellulosilyticus TaxID=2665665 RepID=A0ABW2Q5U5_9BACL
MVQSIDRAMQIINILISDDSKNSWAISEIANETGLPLGSVHRIISTLMKHGLVSQIPETKRYKVGYTWMEIGLRSLENIDFREATRPIMEQLALEVKESVYFSIPNGNFAIIIDRVDSPSSVRIIDNLGERIPLHIGAANKSMLAYMDDKKANRIINQLIDSEDDRLTLLQMLREIRTNGFAVSYSEKTEGTASIAAPVIGFNNKIIGSLYINLLSHQIPDDRLSFLIEKVKNAANEASMRIGKTP